MRLSRLHAAIAINFAAAFYSALVDLVVAPAAVRVLYEAETSWLLVILTAAIMITEPFASMWAMRDLMHDAFARGELSAGMEERVGLPRAGLGTVLVAGGLLRFAVYEFLLVTAFRAAGGTFNPDDRSQQLLAAGVGAAVLVKEAVQFVLVLRAMRTPRPVAHWKVRASRLHFAIYYPFFYTVFWSVAVLGQAPIRDSHQITDGLLLAILYSVFFFPMRLTAVVDVMIRSVPWRGRLMLLFSFVLAIVAALRPAWYVV